ncbi:hypothetical protein Gpo141_00000262 [Globisporangium polare]
MPPKAKAKKSTAAAATTQSLVTKSAVYFYGQRDPTFGCLSNFHPCRFQDEDGQKFFSSEQFFMKKKQETFDPENEELALAILKAKSPPVAKKLGRQVQNYDDRVWGEKRFGFMVEALKLKFSSDEQLRDTLLATEHKSLYEASRSDAIWGIGVSVEKIQETFRESSRFREMGDLDEETRANWFGSNLLGKALLETRSWLISSMGQDLAATTTAADKEEGGDASGVSKGADA